VANVAIPGAVYREVHAACRSTIDLGLKAGSANVLARNFVEIARERLVP
jgi:hypothetical protein